MSLDCFSFNIVLLSMGGTLNDGSASNTMEVVDISGREIACSPIATLLPKNVSIFPNKHCLEMSKNQVSGWNAQGLLS